MNTPADKPDLPALPICDGFGKHGDELYLPSSVREYGQKCADAARADERRKARAEFRAELKPVAYLMQSDIDELRKTGRRAAVIYSESVSPLDVALTIIPKE